MRQSLLIKLIPATMQVLNKIMFSVKQSEKGDHLIARIVASIVNYYVEIFFA